jgi:transcriptional regulator with XRE-family HTH domain
VADDVDEPWFWDDMGYEMNFVTQMRERRETKGWSQTEMARQLTERGLKFHQTTVQRVEIGQRPLKLTEAMTIANVLGVKFEIMLRGDSVELAYNELADAMNSGALDFLTREAETIERGVKRNVENTRELIGYYERAVASITGVEPNAELIAVANEFVRLNETLQDDAHGLAMLMRAAKKIFDGLDRNYPAEYGPDA